MTSRRSRPSHARAGVVAFLLKLALALLLVGVLLLALYATHLDHRVQERFSGSLWALPAKVYARAMELWVGLPLSPIQLERELGRLGYRQTDGHPQPGEYRKAGVDFEVHARRAQHVDGEELDRLLRIRFEGNRVAGLWDEARKPVDLARLDPPLIGSFYPDKQEDRILLRLQDAPPLLVQTLLAVEDQAFFTHHGVNPWAILRAMMVNLASGQVAQGGSTITQQLAKNFFLSHERTISRKLTELIMAIELEWHYSKEQILEAYLNEVWLGQDGNRAIHGFGLASEFYFSRPLGELAPDQIALLVGMVKGASYYNPRRHPERALERRNVVLGVMAEQGLISPEQYETLRRQGLGVSPTPGGGQGLHPAFMQLVRRQLKQEYNEEALRTLGLRIYTTLDPEVQWQAEQAVAQQLPRLEKRRKLPEGSLQAAVIVTEPTSGEVLAVVGDREPRFEGFNRALDARRPIGSLVKPAIYLTALEQPQRYGLGTLLEDAPLTLEQPGSPPWSPENYDREYRGQVPLFQALAHSLNLPAVRVGLDVGVDKVAATLLRLGGTPPDKPTPAMLLGAVEMSPFEVTQMYQTLAAGGFQTPLRAIRGVLDADGRPLARYALTVRQAAQPAPVFLVTTAMQGTVREGTAAALGKALPGLQLAGKTGTTNDLRDSWFAGFSADRLAVVWVGRDDNQPTKLTGASGALPIFTQIMRALPQRPRSNQAPAGVEWVSIDPSTGWLAGPGCPGAVVLPYIEGTAPREMSGCGEAPIDQGSDEESLIHWFNQLLQ
ncbi:MAG: penicillin-binding protein 1B [Halothiobacillaceae bacterium]